MRTIVFIVFLSFIFLACSKDKFNTVPRIEFKSISPNVFYSDNLNPFDKVSLTLQLTDAEGDFGFKGKDSSYVYIKNLTIPPFKMDSLKFPDLSALPGGNMNVEVSVDINNVLAVSNGTRPFTDTLFFEIYVKDFAKNKSNVIVTTEPLYFISP